VISMTMRMLDNTAVFIAAKYISQKDKRPSLSIHRRSTFQGVNSAVACTRSRHGLTTPQLGTAACLSADSRTS
jgi:hypothetical protein